MLLAKHLKGHVGLEHFRIQTSPKPRPEWVVLRMHGQLEQLFQETTLRLLNIGEPRSTEEVSLNLPTLEHISTKNKVSHESGKQKSQCELLSCLTHVYVHETFLRYVVAKRHSS